MSLESKMESIEYDIQNGLKFKSADRLRNLINQYPNEQKLWNRLAEMYYESGFLDGAGRYWILTEPSDERIKKSIEAYQKSVNYSGYQILQEITFRGDKNKLTEYGKRKLAELEKDSKNRANYVPEFKPKTNKSKGRRANQKMTFKDKMTIFPIVGLFIFLAICSIIGVVKVVQWIF